MPVMLRLTRGGQKKRPYYHIVATDKRNPRDGRFIERVGAYNPMLAKDDPNRVSLMDERIKYWLDNGAKPSERVEGFLYAAGLIKSKTDISHRPQKSRKRPSKKTRAEVRAEAEAEAKAKSEAESAEAETTEEALAEEMKD